MNFMSEDDAMAFKALWQKKRLPHLSSHKPLNIGLNANLARLKAKRVRCMEMRDCKPIIVKGGRCIPVAQALEEMA